MGCSAWTLVRRNWLGLAPISEGTGKTVIGLRRGPPRQATGGRTLYVTELRRPHRQAERVLYEAYELLRI
ncbi:hypothetical protein AB0F13_04040 [Streptomyces sp. NPDC026206]|uniref:hypothetical protein n=1 Tax=Streptomyces sp. NPDC026206 TaxID=3157089 RepID=UPI0034071D33